MKYSHHQTKYIGKYVGLRTYQHPGITSKVPNTLSLNLTLSSAMNVDCLLNFLSYRPLNIFFVGS
jgi:hypothetical protein